MNKKDTNYCVSHPRLTQWSIKHKINGPALTNEIFLTNDRRFLKVSRFAPEPIIDRQNEINIWKFLQQHNFSRTIHPEAWGYLNNGRFYSLYRYLPDLIPITPKHLTTETLKAIKTILQQLHNLPVTNCHIKSFNPARFWHNIKTKITIPIPFALHETQKILQWVGSYKVIRKVLCHSDLVLANLVLASNQLLLIDFEYAYLNDPLYDVASLIAEGLTNQAQVRRWLQIWNLTAQKRKIVWHWTQYQNLKNVLWAWLMWQNTKKTVYKHIAQQQYQLLKNPLFMN